MKLSLKKYRFRRQRRREKAQNGYLNRASNGFIWASQIAIALFFTPMVAFSSLLLKDVLLMLVNIAVSFGYVSNFIYRARTKQLSATEKTVVFIGIIAACVSTLTWLPAMLTAVSFGLNSLIAINCFALAINTFFMLEKSLLPFCRPLIQWIRKGFGFGPEDDCYYCPELLPKERMVVNRLMETHCNRRNQNFCEEDIKPFNQTINLISRYINKYHNVTLGPILNQSQIQNLDEAVQQLTIKGDASSCYSFIKRKLSFKQTKCDLLNTAKDKLVQASQHGFDKEYQNQADYYFKHGKLSKTVSWELLHQKSVSLLDNEIARQEEKIAELNNCMP